MKNCHNYTIERVVSVASAERLRHLGGSAATNNAAHAQLIANWTRGCNNAILELGCHVFLSDFITPHPPPSPPSIRRNELQAAITTNNQPFHHPIQNHSSYFTTVFPCLWPSIPTGAFQIISCNRSVVCDVSAVVWMRRCCDAWLHSSGLYFLTIIWIRNLAFAIRWLHLQHCLYMIIIMKTGRDC